MNATTSDLIGLRRAWDDAVSFYARAIRERQPAEVRAEAKRGMDRAYLNFWEAKAAGDRARAGGRGVMPR